MSILSEILADKRSEVYTSRKHTPVAELEKRIADMPPPKKFIEALLAAPAPAIIAEVKKASPSKGVIKEDFDPVAVAKIYEANGAACLSVLTDHTYFLGKLDDLLQIRNAVDLPLLRKDFMIDDYQLLEARAYGADCVLLIAAALTATELEWMVEGTHALGMNAIIEVHDQEEMESVLATSAKLIGINNRDLHKFRTTLQTTLDLMPMVPLDRIIISESGISKRSDIESLGRAGVRAMLIGEALMREQDIGAKLRELRGVV